MCVIIVVMLVRIFVCRLLATTSADATVRIWRTADFSLMTELKENSQRWVWDCAFSGDSQYLLTGKQSGMWDCVLPDNNLYKTCKMLQFGSLPLYV